MNGRSAAISFLTASCLASALLAACASTVQMVPVASGPIADGSARIILSRPKQFHGTASRIAVTDNGAWIGEVGPGDQLVWDRAAGPMELMARNTLSPRGSGQGMPLDVQVGAGQTYQVRAFYPFSGNVPELELVSGTPVPGAKVGTSPGAGPAAQASAVGAPESVPLAAVRNAGGGFDAIEVRRFTKAAGLACPEVLIYNFSEGVREGLTKLNVANKVVPEGALAAEAGAASSIVVEGRIVEYSAGGFLRGPGRVSSEISLFRASDHALIRTVRARIPFKSSPLNEDATVGRLTGQRTVSEIEDAFKE